MSNSSLPSSTEQGIVAIGPASCFYRYRASHDAAVRRATVTCCCFHAVYVAHAAGVWEWKTGVLFQAHGKEVVSSTWPCATMTRPAVGFLSFVRKTTAPPRFGVPALHGLLSCRIYGGGRAECGVYLHVVETAAPGASAWGSDWLVTVCAHVFVVSKRAAQQCR